MEQLVHLLAQQQALANKQAQKHEAKTENMMHLQFHLAKTLKALVLESKAVTAGVLIYNTEGPSSSKPVRMTWRHFWRPLKGQQ